MAIEQFVNNAITTLNGSISSGATTLLVGSATLFPVVGNFRILIDAEIMLVTAVSGTTFTVTRGVEGTTAASHTNGVNVAQVLTNGGLLSILTALLVPQGRLTLQSATPVMTSDQTAKGTIYYDTYIGHIVPVNQVLYQIPSDEISLVLDATHHLSTNLYDIFAINNGGVLQIVTGPAWTNSTTRSAAIALSNGIWVNSGSITHAYNNSVDYGPIAANAGTYLGTFYATANGQTGMQFTPSAANGGSNTILGLYNGYNRLSISSRSADNTSFWTYSSATWRSANGSNANRITFIDGLGQSFVIGSCIDTIGSSATGLIGMLMNANTGNPHVAAYSTVSDVLTVVDTWSPVLGLNFIQAMERTTGSSTNFIGGNNIGTDQSQYLTIKVDI